MTEDKVKKIIMNSIREFLNENTDGELTDENFLCAGGECYLVNIEELYENFADWAIAYTDAEEQIGEASTMTAEELNKKLEEAASGRTWGEAIENYNRTHQMTQKQEQILEEEAMKAHEQIPKALKEEL